MVSFYPDHNIDTVNSVQVNSQGMNQPEHWYYLISNLKQLPDVHTYLLNQEWEDSMEGDSLS